MHPEWSSTTLEEARIKWVIKSRIKTQKFLLKFSIWMNSEECKRLLKNRSAQSFRLATGMLQGSAFALWRTCFLINNSDNPPDDSTLAELVVRGEINFLEHLARHNSIAYAQDKASHYWTCRYYLNDSIFRNFLLQEHLENFTKEQSDYPSGFESEIHRIGEMVKILRSDHKEFLGWTFYSSDDNLDNSHHGIKPEDIWKNSFKVLKTHQKFVKQYSEIVALGPL